MKLKDLLEKMHFINYYKLKVEIEYKGKKFLEGRDDIEWLMDKSVEIIDFYQSVVLIRLNGDGMKETHVELLEAQLVIGKSVIESMLELIPKKGTEKATIPVTIDGYEFEVEVKMK